MDDATAATNLNLNLDGNLGSSTSSVHQDELNTLDEPVRETLVYMCRRTLDLVSGNLSSTNNRFLSLFFVYVVRPLI